LAYAYLPDYRRTRGDLYVTGATLEELADKIAVPRDRFVAAVDAYNSEVASGDDSRSLMKKGPFHALGPIQSWIILADVGLAVDSMHRVLDDAGKPMPGLYAAGSAGQGGAMLWGHGHHIGWAMTSGRRAGRFAATAPTAVNAED
jgi:fumarate reductase flavoprotein subunit